MTARDTLDAFFAAENRRDWTRYADFLHHDVEWTIGGRTVRGRAAYLEAIMAAYAGSDMQFRLHQVISSADAGLVVTLLVDSAGNRSLDVFALENGVIRREWEYPLGPGADWTGQALEF